ncbi:MAG: hypothetical protein ACRDO7_10190 [Nocardioidaceae bacterium]
MATESSLVERFKPTIGRWWGVVGLAMVAFVMAAVISSGTDPATLAVATGALFVGWATYAALVRPTIHAYDDHLLLRNALSDLRLPWKLITDVDVKQTTCVYTGAERHHGIAIGKSARYLIRGENRARSLNQTRAQDEFGSRPTLTGSDVTGMHYADYVVIRIDSLRKDQPPRSDGLAGVEKHWAWPTVAVGAAIVVVFVVLVVLANG